jgi:hypothetical protein
MGDGWIGGRRHDLFFYFGSSVFAAALGGLLLAVPALVVPAFWAWLLLIDGPHLAATYTRTYLDADERRERRTLLLASLLFLLPGPLAVATGRRAPWDLFLLVATFWSWHHNVRQNWGILALYERHARAGARERRLDYWYLHAVQWGLFLLFLAVHPANRSVSGFTLPRPAAIASIAVLAGVTVAWAAARLRGPAIRPALFLLLPVMVFQAFTLFVVGGLEPLIPAPESPEQVFLASQTVGGVVHGLQYLGIVSLANGRRHAGRVLGRPFLVYALLVGGSLAYVALNWARGASPGALLHPESDAGRVFVGLYWGVFFHHYWLDAKIWRPHESPALRRELGLA